MQKGKQKTPFKTPLHTHIKPEYEKLIERDVVDSELTKVKIIDRILAAYYGKQVENYKPNKS